MTQAQILARFAAPAVAGLLGTWSTAALAETSDSPPPLSAPAETYLEQDNDTAPPRTKLKPRGYGGVSTQYTRIMGRDGVLAGFESGVTLNRTLTLGFAAHAFSNPARAPALDSTPRDLELGYGGMVVRHELHIDAPVYFSLGGLVGPAALVATPERALWDDEDRLDAADPMDAKHIDLFTVVHLDARVFSNLTRWARIGVTVGYRQAFGVDKFNADEGDVSGFTTGVALQFGSF